MDTNRRRRGEHWGSVLWILASICLNRFQQPEEVLAALELGKGELQFLRKYHRLEGVPVTEPGQTLDDTIVQAVERLQTRPALSGIDLVLYVHSFQVQTPGDYRLVQRVLRALRAGTCTVLWYIPNELCILDSRSSMA